MSISRFTDHDHGAAQQHHGLDDREVAERDALVEQPADAGPGEHRLHHHGHVDHDDEVDAGQRQHGDQGVLEGVLGDDEGLRQALEAGELDVLGAQHLQHGGARQPHVRGGEVPAERECRHQQVPAPCPSPTMAATPGRRRRTGSAPGRPRTRAATGRAARTPCPPCPRSGRRARRRECRWGCRSAARRPWRRAPAAASSAGATGRARTPACGSRTTGRSRRATRLTMKVQYCTQIG